MEYDENYKRESILFFLLKYDVKVVLDSCRTLINETSWRFGDIGIDIIPTENPNNEPAGIKIHTNGNDDCDYREVTVSKEEFLNNIYLPIIKRLFVQSPAPSNDLKSPEKLSRVSTLASILELEKHFNELIKD